MRWAWPGLIAVAACGGEAASPGGVVASNADPRQNVMVVDDGFDPGDPVLAGRVADAYTVVCQGDDPILEVGRDAGAPADRKASLLALLRTPDTRCHLRAGIEDKPDPLADISTYRPAWNRVVENDTDPGEVFTQAQLRAIWRGNALTRGSYHGTATAGLVAHANPDVRLVLVEMELGPDEDGGGGGPRCFDQGALDETVALFSDPEVARAYAERPSALGDQMNGLLARHRVGLVNESFGYLSREAWESWLREVGCPAVSLRPYLGLLGRLEEEWARAHAGPEVLLVKSAGNDGSDLVSAEDLPHCAPTTRRRLMVGAYGPDGLPASFTNRGPCVDVSALGVDVVAHLPGGWLMPLAGTSFAAPLLVRLISLDRGAGPFSPAGARAALLALRDSQGRVPLARFPPDLLFDPGHLAETWVMRAAVPSRPDRRRLTSLLRLARAARD